MIGLIYNSDMNRAEPIVIALENDIQQLIRWE